MLFLHDPQKENAWLVLQAKRILQDTNPWMYDINDYVEEFKHWEGEQKLYPRKGALQNLLVSKMNLIIYGMLLLED